MASFTSRNVPYKLASEKILAAADLSPRMRSGETIGGSPSITPSSSGLVVSSVTVSSTPMTILNSTVAAGQAVTFYVSNGTAGKLYSLTLASTTSAGQELSNVLGLRVV